MFCNTTDCNKLFPHSHDFVCKYLACSLDTPHHHSTVLEEANEVINGPRREAYGPVEESFKRHAQVWNAILMPKLKEEITPEEVTLMMIGLKLMRESNSHSRDNLIDLAGYTALLAKLHNE